MAALVPDVQLPDVGGLEVQRHLAKLGSRMPIVLVTERGDIPKDPVRHRIHGIETFNALRGGEYSFYHAEFVGTEMDRKSPRNRLDPAEGAVTDVTRFRPVHT